MASQLGAFSSPPPRENTNDLFDTWAQQNLDIQGFKGDLENTRAEAERLKSSIEGVLLIGCLELEARDGTTFVVPAPQAMQTCGFMKDSLWEPQHSMEYRPIVRMGTAFSPYTLSCMINFWVEKRVDVDKHKKLRYVIQTSEDGTDFVIAGQLSTSEALIELHAAAIEWRDAPMKQACVARLRHHLVKNHANDKEILEGLKSAEHARMRQPDEDHNMIKRIFLTALMRKAKNIASGEMKDSFKVLFFEEPSLAFDVHLASLYHNSLFPVGFAAQGQL